MENNNNLLSNMPQLADAFALATDRIQKTILERRSDIENVFSPSESLTWVLNTWDDRGFDASLIERVNADLIPGARAAYAQDLDTIFLSESLFDSSATLESLVDVLIEEFGHRIDALVNDSDTLGDEGRLFAAVVRGEPADVIMDEDHGTITLADRGTFEIEQSVSVSDSGGYEGSYETITLEATGGGTIDYYYQHYTIPDRFIIRYEGRTLFDTGFTGGSRSGSLTLPAGQSDTLDVIIATDNAGTAWNYSVTVNTECQAPDPWIIEGVTQKFQSNAQTQMCETTGTVDVGRRDGTSTLISVVGTSKSEFDKNHAVLTSGTFYSGIGNISESLFSATADLNFNSGTVALKDIQPGTFKLASLDVEFKSMTLLSDTVGFDVTFTMPDSVAGLLINTVDYYNYALRFSNQGVNPVLGFKIAPPITKQFKFLDKFNVEASHMSIEYRGQENALRFQAKLAIESTGFAKLADNANGFKSLVADLSGNDNYVQINADGDISVIGALKMEGRLNLVKGWSLKELELKLNTVAQTIDGSAVLGTPFGLKFGEGAELKPSLGITYDPFQLNSVGLTIDNLNKPIPAYPYFFFQSIGGSVNHLADADLDPVEATFTIGATLGPQIGGTRLARSQFDAKVDENSITGSITTDLLTANFSYGLVDLGQFSLVTDQSMVELNWNKGTMKFVGTSNVLDGFFVTTGTFVADSEFNFGFARTGQLSIPNFVPTFGGKNISSSNLALNFVNDGNSSNDYAAGWGTYTIHSWLGDYNLVLGLRIGFDGNISAIGANNLPNIGSWDIEAGTEFVVLSASWENADPNARVEIIQNAHSDSPTVISEADFIANNMDVIEDLSSDTSRTVLIKNPTAGIWDIRMVDESGLGDVTYEATGATEISEFDFSGNPYANGAYTIGFDYTADIVGDSATVSFYYDDDLSTLDGIFAGSTVIGDGPGTFNWNTVGVVPDQYYLYAMVDDGSGPITIAEQNTPVSAGSEADVEISIVQDQESVLAGDTVRYTVTATNQSGSNMANGVVALLSLSDVITLTSSSIDSSASDFADYAFVIGDMTANEVVSFTVDVVVDPTAMPGDSVAADVYVMSDSYDSDSLNDTAGIQTLVQTPADEIVELTVNSNLDTLDQPGINDTLEYVVTIENTGNTEATGVVLNESFNNLINLSSDLPFTVSGTVLNVPIGTIPAGEQVVVNFTGTVMAAGTVQTTSRITANEVDGDIVNNEEISILNALAALPDPADLSLTMDGIVDDNGHLSVDVTLTNSGPSIATGIEVAIDLPEDAIILSANSIQGTYDQVTEIWSVGNMRDNISRTMTLIIENPKAIDQISAEVVSVFEDDPDSVPGDGTGDDFVSMNFASDFIGGSGSDVLQGSSGKDVIYALNGNDTVLGRSGNDTLYGGNGDDSLLGGSGQDSLYGGNGNDYLVGGSGDDLLVGNQGADTLKGGSGDDMFRFVSIFDSRGAGTDTIQDFSSTEDHIDFSAIDANSLVAGHQVFQWEGENTDVLAHSLTWYEDASGTVILQADVNGDNSADMRIKFIGLDSELVDSDFILAA